MVANKDIYLQRARELCNNEDFINLVNQYPDDFFNFGYHRYFKRLQNPSEFLALIDEYRRENEQFENVTIISELKPDELSEIILWAFNKQEDKIRKGEHLETEVEETIKYLKDSPILYRPRKKISENRDPSFGVFEKE